MMENFYKTDEGSFIRFEWDTAKNNFLSEKEKRPVFDKVLIGYVSSPGQQKSTATHEFIREDIYGKVRENENACNRYRNAYEAFTKNNDGGDLQGTPIEQWKEINMKIAASLKALNIHTVEAMAQVPDGMLANVGMGARELQNKAKAYIEACKSADSAISMAKDLKVENQTLKEANESLQKSVAELMQRVSELEASPKKRKNAQ